MPIPLLCHKKEGIFDKKSNVVAQTKPVATPGTEIRFSQVHGTNPALIASEKGQQKSEGSISPHSWQIASDSRRILPQRKATEGYHRVKASRSRHRVKFLLQPKIRLKRYCKLFHSNLCDWYICLELYWPKLILKTSKFDCFSVCLIPLNISTLSQKFVRYCVIDTSVNILTSKCHIFDVVVLFSDQSLTKSNVTFSSKFCAHSEQKVRS